MWSLQEQGMAEENSWKVGKEVNRRSPRENFPIDARQSPIEKLSNVSQREKPNLYFIFHKTCSISRPILNEIVDRTSSLMEEIIHAKQSIDCLFYRFFRKTDLIQFFPWHLYTNNLLVRYVCIRRKTQIIFQYTKIILYTICIMLIYY